MIQHQDLRGASPVNGRLEQVEQAAFGDRLRTKLGRAALPFGHNRGLLYRATLQFEATADPVDYGLYRFDDDDGDGLGVEPHLVISPVLPRVTRHVVRQVLVHLQRWRWYASPFPRIERVEIADVRGPDSDERIDELEAKIRELEARLGDDDDG